MKKTIGWILIIAGLGNIIRTFGLASTNQSGDEQRIGELFLFGLVFLIIGGWMIKSSNKKNNEEYFASTKHTLSDQIYPNISTPNKLDNEEALTQKKNNVSNSFSNGLIIFGFLAIFLVSMYILWWNTSRELPQESEAVGNYVDEPIIDSSHLDQSNILNSSTLSVDTRSLKDPFSSFKIGSTKEQVKKIMGTPTAVYEDDYFKKTTWYYGRSSIVFKNGKVKEYFNYGNLRIE